jgi:hypothetical protein
MMRLLSILALTLVLHASRGGAQSPEPQSRNVSPSNETMGMRLGPVPALLFEHLPGLKRGTGLVVEQIQSNCAAATGGVRIHDILLAYDGHPIRSRDQFCSLVRGIQPARDLPLVLLRGGKEITLQVRLTCTPLPQPIAVFGNTAKGSIKAGGPPAINVEAERLPGDRLQVTFTYYSQGTGKLEQVQCSGSLTDIENEVRELGKQNRMPSRVQDLADVALRRIRVLNFPPK